MKSTLALLVLFSLTAFAGQAAVDSGSIQGEDTFWIMYDDCTPADISWEGTYRGVWFNLEDFIPGICSAYLLESKFWFYHMETGYAWDTSDVYLELWKGDSAGPFLRRDQTLVTALHYAPVGVQYWPIIHITANSWVLANTELSTGGWPSLLSDEMTSQETHSYYSDDFTVWNPWGTPGACGDYFVSLLVSLNPPYSLTSTTWGSLKATF